jgi:competence protein ComEC
MMKNVRPLSTALGAIVLGGSLVACSSGSPTTTTAPTAQVVATQAAPTVQALATTGAQVATQAVPTAQALATQSAPTVQALATTGARVATQGAPTAGALATQSAPTVQAVATQAAPAVATAAASSPVRILGAESNGTDSMISLQNASDTAVDLNGWVLQVGTASAHLPSLTIQPGQSVTLHSTSGTNTATDVYLGADASALAQQAKPGARVVLQNPSGAPTTAFTIPSA